MAHRTLPLAVLLLAALALPGCVVAPGPGYYAPPAASVYVAPRPYPYYAAPRYYRPSYPRPYYGRPYYYRRW